MYERLRLTCSIISSVAGTGSMSMGRSELVAMICIWAPTTVNSSAALSRRSRSKVVMRLKSGSPDSSCATSSVCARNSRTRTSSAACDSSRVSFSPWLTSISNQLSMPRFRNCRAK